MKGRNFNVTRAQCVTNIEISNEYEYEYIRDVNLGTNMNIFFWLVLEYF